MQILSKAETLVFVRAHQALFDHAERSNPFAGSAWTLHFLEQVAEDSWTFALPEASGESLMLLYSDTPSSYRRASVANYYTSLVSPLISSLVSAQERAEAMANLVQQAATLGPRCSCIRLAPLDCAAADTASLRQALAAVGWYVKQYDCFGNWYLPCAQLSFADYMGARSSQLQSTWARKQKKFEKTAGARLEIVVNPEGVAAAMDAYEAIYAKSWKRPEPYKDFVRQWALICARKGWLRLGVAWLGDVPVAAQFWFTLHGRAYIFKLAYDEAHANLSAGTVLSAHLFRQALDVDQVVEVDFLTGDDAYKQSWMTHRRQRVGLVAYNPWTARGLVVGAVEMAGDMTRPWRARLQASAGAARRWLAKGASPGRQSP